MGNTYLFYTCRYNVPGTYYHLFKSEKEKLEQNEAVWFRYSIIIASPLVGEKERPRNQLGCIILRDRSIYVNVSGDWDRVEWARKYRNPVFPSNNRSSSLNLSRKKCDGRVLWGWRGRAFTCSRQDDNYMHSIPIHYAPIPIFIHSRANTTSLMSEWKNHLHRNTPIISHTDQLGGTRSIINLRSLYFPILFFATP